MKNITLILALYGGIGFLLVKSGDLWAGDKDRLPAELGDEKVEQNATQLRGPMSRKLVAKENAHGLSVSPSVEVGNLTPDRPDWVKLGVKQGPQRVEGVDQILILSDPFDRARLRREDLDRKLKKSVDRYVNDYLQRPNASLFVNYSVEDIGRRLISRNPEHEYIGRVNSSAGLMWEEAHLVRVDEGFRRELDQRWRHVVATSRLISTALIAGGLLGLLGIVFTFFRIDTATRGFYTRRLQLVTLLVILGMIGAGVWIAQFALHNHYITWML